MMVDDGVFGMLGPFSRPVCSLYTSCVSVIFDNGPRACKPRAVLVCDEIVELIKQTATLQ